MAQPTEFRGQDDAARMQNLLRWGISNTAEDSTAPVDPLRSREHLEMLNNIMASRPSDAQRMKAAMLIIDDEASDMDDRLTGWDELENLVESLDNANDLEPLKLWPEIVKYLHHSEPELVVQALWVCGTAVQNNPKAQQEFLDTDSLSTVIRHISSSSNTAEVRSKAIYCLGSAIKHHQGAYDQFVQHQGWATLEAALKDPSIQCRRKAAFLIDSIFQNSPADKLDSTLQDARQSKALETLVQTITPQIEPFGSNGDQTSDADLHEKAISALFGLLSRAGSQALTKAEKAEVLKALKQPELSLNLAESERLEFVKLLEA